MKKFIKSTIAVASAIAMTVTMAASGISVVKADDLSKSKAMYNPSIFTKNEVHYTAPGGCTPGGWEPFAESNTLEETEIAGVYAMEIEVPAYDKATEWNNRFKICRLDNTINPELSVGWDYQLKLGTTAAGNNGTQIRIENKEAGKFKVYFKPATGAVVIKDAAGATVDYTISWVGNEKEAPVIAANDNDFLTCEAAEKTTFTDWVEADLPAGVTAVPAFTTINKELETELANFNPAVMAKGEVHYTAPGGCTASWDPFGRANELKETEVAGVYSMEIEVPAYDKAAEWNNRFKICKLDNTINPELSVGWDYQVKLGTTAAGDNGTQIRIENKEAGKYTVYFKPATGAVVIKDAAGAIVDYTISWVGNEKEAPVIAANDNDFLTCEAAEKTTLTDWVEKDIPEGVTAVPTFTTINKELETELANFNPAVMAKGEVHYTAPGGCTASWDPFGRANELKETEVAGIYSMEIEVPAYDKAAEWNNRFKICKLDNTINPELSVGWDYQVKLGTTAAGDNGTQIRIENKEAGKYTVYFKPATGAVVIKDAAGAIVDYTISWVGNEKEAPVIAANDNDFLTCEAAEKTTLTDWVEKDIPEGVTAVPTFTTINKELETEILNFNPAVMAKGEVHYTAPGGCTASWDPFGRANELKETRWEGVYSLDINVPAYDKAAEWNNRFKICKIDNTINPELSVGWDYQVKLGTTAAGDNGTQIRIENKEAGKFTVYFDSTTGAVVIKDAAGATVDYTISWVGNEKEAPVIAANDNDFLTCAAAEKTTLTDWVEKDIPEGVTAVPAFTEINAALEAKLLVVPAQKEEVPPVQKSLKLTYSTKTVYTGKDSKIKIKATVTGSSKKVTWKSSRPSVATVSKSGSTATVKAKKAGKTVISATANGITKKVTITVKNPSITVKQGSKKVSSISLKRGKSTTLKVTTSPSKAGIKATYGSSSSKKLIKISTKSGKVTVKALKKKGTAKIKITSGGAVKTIKVTVK